MLREEADAATGSRSYLPPTGLSLLDRLPCLMPAVNYHVCCLNFLQAAHHTALTRARAFRRYPGETGSAPVNEKIRTQVAVDVTLAKLVQRRSMKRYGRRSLSTLRRRNWFSAGQ